MHLLRFLILALLSTTLFAQEVRYSSLRRNSSRTAEVKPVEPVGPLILQAGESNPFTNNGEADPALPKVLSHTTQATKICYRPDQDPLRYRGLEVGQHRLMTQDNYVRKSGPLAQVQRSTTSGNYLVRRLTRSDYQIVLNLDFVSDKLAGAQEMRARSQNCLSALKPQLRGPGNEQLDILILSPSEVLELPEADRPEAVVINVSEQPFEYRGDARNFGTNFSCDVITHEILHHLSLVDEYLEEHANAVEWSCRQVTSDTSLMRNASGTFQEIVPVKVRCECNGGCKSAMAHPEEGQLFLKKNAFELISTDTSFDQFCESTVLPYDENYAEKTKAILSLGRTGNVFKYESRLVGLSDSSHFVQRQAVTCTCPENDRLCTDFFEKVNTKVALEPLRSTCPTGLKHYSTKIGANDGISQVTGNELYINYRGTGESLIKPSHFKKILSGNCIGGAPAYEACEGFAYIGKSHPSCARKPAACGDDNYFLNGERARSNQRQRRSR